LESPRTIQASSSSDNIDFNKLLIIIKNNWIWLGLVLILINSVAYLFIRYTKNIYESDSELKLEIQSNASQLGIKSIVENQNLNIVSGEIEIISSKLFLNRVLDNSNFDVSFYSVGRVLKEELFEKGPASITFFNRDHNLYNSPIYFRELDPARFSLQPGENGKETIGHYGTKIRINSLELVLHRNKDFKKGDEIGYYFVINSRDVLLDYLSRNLTAEPLNYNANTIRISFKDNNPFKAQAVLNKVDTLYLSYSYEQKNQVNKQKIDWLTNELSHIEGRMESYENYFENFILQNKTSDLENDLKNTITTINRIDSQRIDLTRRVTELCQVTEGLTQGEFLLPLSLYHSLPQAVTAKLDLLQQLQIEQNRLKLSYHEITFAYRQKQNQIETLQRKTLEQLNDLKNTWLEKLQELSKRKSVLDKEFASLPDKSTEFTKNQRFYKLYEEFYLTLMQSKSEFEIAQAGSIPDFKILSPATLPSRPISPHNSMIAGIGAVASLTITLFLIGVLYLLNNKITSLHELERIQAVPVLGAVPLSKYVNGGLYILEHPKSMVSEAIRTLRTNLDFFNINSKQRVIALSSTVSGEGKSFIALNLGAAMALSKKTAILIDLDMRKAKTNPPITGGDPTKGISTILIRRNSWKECILKTPLEHFDYIPSGPHPPNPSELLANGEFTELLDDLKKHYDYIIMDTPPVGLVTDGIMVMKRADIAIYMFRANYSKKEFLLNLQRIININKFSNITTLLNAVPSTGKTYGYGYYEEGKPSKLKSFFNL
jgi:tyrosine-protein kinase Etk/Wzc